MRRRLTSWARPLAGVLALVVGMTLAAPPASAAQAKASTARVTTSPLAAKTAAHLAKLAPTPRAFAQTSSAPASDSDSKSFFRSPTGVAAIVLMVAGTAFAVWSIDHDRKPVKSPIR